MPRSKPTYTPEIQQRIVEAIKKHGKYSAVWKTEKIISKKCFEDWRNNNQEFREAVEKARYPNKERVYALPEQTQTLQYNPKIAKRIIDAIATEGTLKAGWEAGGISEAIFREWFGMKSEFSEAIFAIAKIPHDAFPPQEGNGRKLSYTFSSAHRAIWAVHLYGRDEAGWKTARIGESTYYEWKIKYPDFRRQINLAKQVNQERYGGDNIQQIAMDAAIQKLMFGEEILKITYVKDKGTAEETIVQREIRPPSNKIIEMFLASKFDVLEATKIYKYSGLLPEEAEMLVEEHLQSMRAGLQEIMSRKEKPDEG